MLRSILIASAIFSVAACSSVASGCSSSSGGSSGVLGSDATGSSGGDASSSSGGDGGDGGDGPDMCTTPLRTVPANTIPGYVTVAQTIGACTGTDISGYVTACDSTSATNATCGNWFNSAAAACANCLLGPVTGGDPGTPTGQGAIWVDFQGQNIGTNVAGCLDKEGMNECAVAYQNFVECVFSAGCYECPDQSSFTACENTVKATGGACAGYLSSAQSACSADGVEGGLLNGGACSDDTKVLSVICGNGSGDGG